MTPLRDGDRYVPRPWRIGPFTLDGPSWCKRGWNISAEGKRGPGSYESMEAALLACGAVIPDSDYAWGVLTDLREAVNWRLERTIAVADLVERLPRKEEGVPTQFEIDVLTDDELAAYEAKVHATLALIEESRRRR